MSVLIEENILLRTFNTFGINANAKWFTRFNSEETLMELLHHPSVLYERKLILGGGSNILLTGNFDGIVLKNELKGVWLIGEENDYYYVKAAAGENWHSFVMTCIGNNWSGIENLSLIPGSVGASPMQNIGAYGVEIKDVFESLEAYHIHEKRKKIFSFTECMFGYRESIFKRKEKGNWVITSVTFRLRKNPVLHTGYGAIEDELKMMGVKDPDIRSISQAVINIRSSKLPDPLKIGNAGSFFKNPIILKSHYEQLKSSYPEIPSYAVSDSEYKLPAGWLIEKAGWKGKRQGRCGVHDRQALVLVNYGNATGTEIFDLSSAIISDILEKFGIELEREVNII
ncbi:MAG: UDP-N-acetylmuramate dehydrogenase [Crocinitomicaceae bacterium]|nr:UDP-N-acetylmuramate dehydrogenase [Crocinitomicaceae bacterium]